MLNLALSVQDRRVQLAIILMVIIAALATVALTHDIAAAGHATSGS